MPKKQQFTKVPTWIINSPHLSAIQKSICAYVLSKPQGWVFRMTEMRKHFREGRDAIRDAIRTLSASGVLKKRSLRDPKGLFKGYEYVISGNNPYIQSNYVDGKSVAGFSGPREGPKSFHQFQVAVYGRTREEAHAASICIDCGKPIDTANYNPDGVIEYQSSGLCPSCFKALTGEFPECFKPYKLKDM
jgi:hypothetical protein